MDTIDSWTVDRDGITYQIRLVDDQDANQDAAGQGDCYSPSDLAAHAAGDWTFVGVIVTPVIGGRAVDGASDSLWSVEWGTMPAEPEPTGFGGEDAQDAMLKHIGDIVGQGKAPGNKDQASGSSKDKKPASGKMDAEDKKGENANTGDDDEDDE